jgi:signal transduction histidine kinase
MPADQQPEVVQDAGAAAILSDLSRATSEFITVIAHKIHTPVTAIKWQAETLLDEELNELQREMMQGILDAADQLNELSRTLLYVYELEKDLPTLKSEEISVRRIFDRAMKSLVAAAKERQVTIVANGVDLDTSIYADPDLAFVVLRTLLENAICYSPEGTSVDFRIERNTGGTMLIVTDSGCGIPGDLQRLVFSKFFRAPNARRIWTDGAGLNLSIAHSISRRIGWELTFESREGAGTTFRWFVPSHKPQPALWGPVGQATVPKVQEQKKGFFGFFG